MAQLGDYLNQSEAKRRRTEAVNGILARAGIGKGDPDSEYGGLSLLALASDAIERAGINAAGLTGTQIIAHALAHSSSDFPNLLTDALRVAALKGFDEIEATYPRWTSIGSLADFREAKRVAVGALENLALVPEGAEISAAQLGDQTATVSLATYAKIIAITRQAIANDATSELAMISRKAGRSAQRTIAALVAGTLASNPTLADGEATFSAAHANVGTAAAISTDTVMELCELIARQTSNGAVLGLSGKFLIVPPDLAGRAAIIANTTYALSADGLLSRDTPNLVYGRLEVISDPHLTGTAYYLAADPLLVDTLEVNYLAGGFVPRVEAASRFNNDGGLVKVAIDVGCSVLDYRGLAYNAGA